jgi:hypothetical protein
VEDTVTVRYFQRILADGSPVALFRHSTDERAKTLTEARWDSNAGWDPTDRLTEYLVDGYALIEEVGERDAMRAFPDAFESRIAKVMEPTVTVKHLAGKHDQASHGTGGGRASQLNPDNQFGSPFTARMTEDGEFEVDEDGMLTFLEGQKSAHGKVTKREGEAVIAYQSEMYYEEINGGLREQAIVGESDLLTPEVRDIVTRTDSAIAKSSFTEDVVVFRGINDEEGFISGLEPGETFSDPSYQSTSLNPLVAYGFSGAMGEAGAIGTPVVLRVKIPAGKPALASDLASNRAVSKERIDLSPDEASIAGFSFAAEVTLPRNTAMTVTGKEVVDGVTVLDVVVE